MQDHITRNRRPIRLALVMGLVSALLLVLSIGSVATAKEPEKREVKVDVSLSKAVIESESKTTGREDELKIEFDNGSHNFNFEYESDDSSGELESKIKVGLFDLIEWRDTNGNGRYNPNVSGEMVQKMGLGDLASQSLTTEPVAVAGVNGVSVVGVSTAPAKYPGLVMTLKLRMFGEFLELSGTSLEPTAMKFDIGINGFPYQRNDTSLVLYAKVVMKAEDEVDKIGEEGEEVIGARVRKYISFFSWGTTVLVDGLPRTVGQTVQKHEQKTERGDSELVSELYLQYPRGNAILHDPKLGVKPTETSGGCTIF